MAGAPSSCAVPATRPLPPGSCQALSCTRASTPRFFQLPRAVPRARSESVDGRPWPCARRPLAGEPKDATCAPQRARRGQPFESVDQFVTFLPPADDDRRQPPARNVQRPRHGPFRFRAGAGDSGHSVRRYRGIPVPARSRRPSAAQAECTRAGGGRMNMLKLISERSAGSQGCRALGPPSRKTAAHPWRRRTPGAAVFLEGGPGRGSPEIPPRSEMSLTY